MKYTLLFLALFSIHVAAQIQICYTTLESAEKVLKNGAGLEYLNEKMDGVANWFVGISQFEKEHTILNVIRVFKEKTGLDRTTCATIQMLLRQSLEDIEYPDCEEYSEEEYEKEDVDL